MIRINRNRAFLTDLFELFKQKPSPHTFLKGINHIFFPFSLGHYLVLLFVCLKGRVSISLRMHIVPYPLAAGNRSCGKNRNVLIKRGYPLIEMLNNTLIHLLLNAVNTPAICGYCGDPSKVIACQEPSRNINSLPLLSLPCLLLH